MIVKTRSAHVVGSPRGILAGPRGRGRFHHVRFAPPPALAALVQHFWIVRWDLLGRDPQVAESLPHPNVHFVLDPGSSRVHGIHTGRFTRTLEGRGGVFGVKFRPGGFRPFFGRSVSALRDATATAADVFGADAATLETAVFAVEDDTRQVAAVERFLTARLPPADGNVERVAAIVDAAAADRGVTAVEHLAERWDIGRRELQRLFNEYVGVGPKWVINRYRLHEAVERLAAGPAVDCTTLAQELGYFDQAHFTREFKALVGCTPSAYLRKMRANAAEADRDTARGP